MKKKVALITGITGQDGSYLAELLLKKKYRVHGIVRRVAIEDQDHRLWRIKHLLNKIKIHSASLESYASLVKIITKIKPDELYHLGAQSFVAYSFQDEFSTLNSNINGTHYLLSAIKDFSPKTKFYFAGSSEMFGKVHEVPQNENTRFYPRSSYGISKCTGFDLVRNYREAYDLFACTGILFNHESPLRPKRFVTQKIILTASRISKGADEILELGRLDISRDWGWAPEYVEAMWLMLQQDNPEDYVIATGETNTLESFVIETFNSLGLDWKKYVRQKEIFMRPTDIEISAGDASKAHLKLGWKPKNKMKEVIALMLQAVN